MSPVSAPFRPFRLDLRQQACTSKNENCSKIVYCRVQSSFARADIISDDIFDKFFYPFVPEPPLVTARFKNILYIKSVLVGFFFE